MQKANGSGFRLKIVLSQTKISADGERNIWRVSKLTPLPGAGDNDKSGAINSGPGWLECSALILGPASRSSAN